MSVLEWLFGTRNRHVYTMPLTEKHGDVSVTYFFDGRGKVSWINCHGRMRNGRTVSQARWSLHDLTRSQILGVARELMRQVTREISQHDCETFGSTHAGP